MKLLAIALITVVLASPALADEPRENIPLKVAGNALILMDCHQTMQIAGHPETRSEGGPGKIFLGAHPSKKRVLSACAGWLLSVNLLDRYLNKKWSDRLWIGIGIGHGAAVTHNWRVGLRFNF